MPTLCWLAATCHQLPNHTIWTSLYLQPINTTILISSLLLGSEWPKIYLLEINMRHRSHLWWKKDERATGALLLETAEKSHLNVYRLNLKRTTNWQIVPTNNGNSKNEGLRRKWISDANKENGLRKHKIVCTNSFVIGTKNKHNKVFNNRIYTSSYLNKLYFQAKAVLTKV